MIGSLLKLVAERPDLLADHALAYLALANKQLVASKKSMLRRLVASIVALVTGTAFLILVGVALMLITSLENYSLWVLLAVPAAMLVITIVALVIATSKQALPEKKTVIAQLQDDLREFRRISELRS